MVRIQKIERVFTGLGIAIILANVIPVCLAQDRESENFSELIKTPAGIQRALEHCDGDPDFETDFANWLEAAQPQSPAERRAVRETALQLLEDTTESQIALALIDGLLRRALEDLKRDPAFVPERLARSTYADILRAAKNRAFKVQAIATPAYALAEGDVTDERQVSFTETFLNLANPRVRHHVQAAKPAPAARPSLPVPKPTMPPSDESVPVHVGGEVRYTLLMVSVIWLVLHLLRSRRRTA